MDEFDKQFDKVYAALVDGVPTSEPLVDGRPKDEVFASDFLRENPFLKENNNRPLAHIRFFYQAKENAVTRLRFGRDDYRPHQARAEWHKDDWVEMRYERDTHERDYPVGEHNRVWYSIDKTKWKNGSEDIKIEYVNKSHVAGAKDAMQLVRESEPPEKPPSPLKRLSLESIHLANPLKDPLAYPLPCDTWERPLLPNSVPAPSKSI